MSGHTPWSLLSRLSHEGLCQPLPTSFMWTPGHSLPVLSNPSQIPWIENLSHGLDPEQSTAVHWVLHRVPELLYPPYRADPPCRFPSLLNQLRPALLCVPRPHLPHCWESALKGCYSVSFSSGNLSHCKATPSLNGNHGVFKTLNKPLLLAQGQLLTF